MIATHSQYLDAIAKAENAAKAYYDTDVQLMSDEDYDLLVQEIQTVGDANQWTEHERLTDEVAAGMSTGGDVVHTAPMLSLSKVMNVPDAEAFLAKVDTKCVVEPKIDGLAISARYHNGKLALVATRGDGKTGENVTAKASTTNVEGLPNRINLPGDVEVRGEIFIRQSNFEAAQAGRIKATEKVDKDGTVLAPGKPFANPRNAAAGALRTSKDTSYVRMTFAAYDVLGLDEDSYSKRLDIVAANGFYPARDLMPVRVAEATAFADKVSIFRGLKKDWDIPTDGLVLKVDSLNEREELGAGSRHPHWAVAFKYEPEVRPTKLITIERNVGQSGAISYVGVLAPVALAGTTVTRATLNNLDRIREYDVRIGDTIMVRKAGEIIPEVVAVVKADRPAAGLPEYNPPTTCPACGHELDTSEVIWRCYNKSCKGVVLGKLVYAVSRDILDIDGLNESVLKLLIDQGLVTDVGDLFYLTEDTLASLPRGGVNSDGSLRVVGRTLAAKYHAEIEKAKGQPLNRVLSSLSIHMAGRTIARRIASHFGDFASVEKATRAQIQGIEGIGQVKGGKFYDGLRENADALNKMKAAGVKALTDVKTPEADGGASKPLAGMAVCVTGTVPGYTRTQASELVERLGGRAASSVSSKTDLVVVGEGAGSKADKAKQLGLKIVSGADFAVWAKKF